MTKTAKKLVHKHEKENKLFEVRVDSKSTSGFRTVKFWKNGMVTCDCPAGKYHGSCRHIEDAKVNLSSHQWDKYHEASGESKLV